MHFESVCSVIAIAVHGNMKLHQVDVKTTFLNGELCEEVSLSNLKGL